MVFVKDRITSTNADNKPSNLNSKGMKQTLKPAIYFDGFPSEVTGLDLIYGLLIGSLTVIF